MFKTVLALTKKELGSYLNSSLAYVIVVPFLVLSFFLYFRTAFVFGEASLRAYFDLLPWFMALLLPALTMSSLTEEKTKKTLELLLAHPLSELEIVCGKFFSVSFFWFLILLTTAPLALPLVLFSKFDTGVLVAQYLAAFLSGLLLISVGLAAGSLYKSQIAAFLTGAFICAVLIFSGMDFVSLSLPQPFGSLVSGLGLNIHYNTLSQGLLDLSDIVYFVFGTIFFLIVAVFNISRDKLSEKGRERRKLYISFSLVIVLGLLLTNLLNGLSLRFDLTESRLYSLSPATKKILNGLDDILTIHLFASPDLPAPTRATLQNIRAILSDYQKDSSKVKVSQYSPQDSNKDAQLAQSEGVRPIQFNTIGSSSYQLQAGYLGLSLRYGTQTQSIPYIQDSQTLEYRISRLIKKLTQKSAKTVDLYAGLANTPQLGNSGLALNNLSQVLSSLYSVESLADLTKISTNRPDLLVAAINSPLDPKQVEGLKSYLDGGGRALLMLDKITTDPSVTIANPQTLNLEDLLKGFGVNLNSNLVYDPSLAESVQFSQGQTTLLLPYPFWIRALPSDPKFPPTTGIESVTLFWPSTLTLTNADGFKDTPILKTSQNGGTLSGSDWAISPDKITNSEISQLFGPLTLGALVQKSNGDNLLVVIMSAELASDRFASPNNQNLSFVSNLADYLTLNSDEIVPVHQSANPSFVFTKPWQPAAITWGLTLGVPLLVSLIGFISVWRRRRGFSRTFNL
ncbi:MAG: Gldg family protein [Patescibacteria group bacterium]|nr:Gldg family protein [Patescibacteria group bacterium]